MKKFRISVTLEDLDYLVEAAYYKIDDGILTFKDADHAAKASFNWSTVTSVCEVAEKH